MEEKKKKNRTISTKKTSISLPLYHVGIIQKEMASGKYRSVSHLICDALILLEKESYNLEKAKKRMRVR